MTRRMRPSGDRLLTLEHGPVQQTTTVGFIRECSVERARVVPHNEVADLPVVAADELGLGRPVPQPHE